MHYNCYNGSLHYEMQPVFPKWLANFNTLSNVGND
jgi:hypothetical protein